MKERPTVWPQTGCLPTGRAMKILWSQTIVLLVSLLSATVLCLYSTRQVSSSVKWWINHCTRSLWSNVLYTAFCFVTVGLCDAPGSGGLWCKCSDLQVCSDAHSHCCIWGSSWMLAMASPSRCRYQQTGMTSDALSTQVDILYTI